MKLDPGKTALLTLDFQKAILGLASGAEAVIPSTTSRRAPIPYDTIAYRDRNRVERMWCRLKDFRRVATRYDKLARNYLSGAFLAAACAYWLN